MTTRRQVFKWGGLAGAAIFAGGTASCGFSAPTENSSGSGEISIQGTTIPTLDPQVVTNGMWLMVQGLAEGLVVSNDQGTDVAPGLAEKWDISADGLTYTFHLRSGLKWSDGSELLASDFEYAYKRLLEPKAAGAGVTLGASSYVASTNILNALEFQAGSETDWTKVGFKVTDDKTLTFTLASPNQGFLMGMAHPSMLPLPQKLLEAKGAEWEKVENIVTNGPFKVTAITPNSGMTFQKNEHYWDVSNIKLSQINYRQSDSTVTILPFENGEVDIMAISDAATLLRFQNEEKLKPQRHSGTPGSITYLALMHSKNEVLSDVRIREALSLAMGREALSAAVPFSVPAYSLVPTSVPGWDESVAIKEDIEKAKQLLSDAGFPMGAGLPPINVCNGGADAVLAIMADNLKKNLGVTLKNDTVEAGVYVKKRAGLSPADYVGFYYGSFASELNWSKWVGSLWSPTFAKPFSLGAADYQAYLDIQADTSLKPAEVNSKLTELANSKASDLVKNFDQLTVEAMATADPTASVAAFKKAALAREQCFLFLPLLMNANQFAVNPRVTGFNPRPTGDQYYYKTLGVQ